ncbi:MAG: FkbM family methyltransferase [Burkholderiales bacterium]
MTNNPSDLQNRLLKLTNSVDDIAKDLRELLSDIKVAHAQQTVSAQLAEIRTLVGPFGVPMPGERMLVQTIHGIKYLIDPHDLIMAPQLIVYRQWEPDLTQYFLSAVDSTTVFVDVGANFGYFTCLAGARIGASGKGSVTSFEPNPKLFSLLRDNCAINWSMCGIQLHEMALAENEGAFDLWVPNDRAANASLTQLDGASPVAVKVKSLDSVLGNEAVVDIMKVDVEGHEAGVLRGARQVIERSPNINIVLEWSVSQMREANSEPEQMIDLFSELGLAAYQIPRSREEDLVKYRDEELVSTHYANLLLRHR